MVYIIIVVVMLLILAPIIAILPSRTQKEKMAKRRAAMGRGVGVGLTQIEDPDPDPQKYVTATGKPIERKLSVACYELRRKLPLNWRTPLDIRWAVQQFPGEEPALLQRWHWTYQPSIESSELRDFLRETLPGLPSDTVMIEEAGGVVRYYWHEQGDEQVVSSFLESCVSLSLVNPGDKKVE